MFNVVNKNVSKSMSITFLSSFKPNPRHIKFPLFSLMEQCSLWVWKNLLSLWSWIILSSKHQNSTRTATNWNQKSLCVSSLNIFCECFCLLFIKKLQKVSKSFKKFSNVVIRISTFEKWEKFIPPWWDPTWKKWGWPGSYMNVNLFSPWRQRKVRSRASESARLSGSSHLHMNRP